MHFDLVQTVHAADIDTLILKINKAIINPAIGLIFAIALAVFLYGVVEFILKKASDEGRATGKQHMFWGVIGMAIMLGAFGIVNLIIGSIG